HRVAFTADGRGLLFSSADELAMADPTTGRRLDLPGGMRGRTGHVGEFTADGRTLATFANDEITLWDWPNGKVRVSIKVPLAPAKPQRPNEGPEVVTVNSVSLSPDGRFLFTNSVRWDAYGGHQNSNDVWDARSGKLCHRLKDPETEYPPAAFASDAG